MEKVIVDATFSEIKIFHSNILQLMDKKHRAVDQWGISSMQSTIMGDEIRVVMTLNEFTVVFSCLSMVA